MDQIPVFRPLLRDAEIQACVEALELGWLGMGAYVGQFEDGLKAYMEAEDRYVVGVSTGHAALHLAMLLFGVGPGDEVITPSFNNIADFQAILATGASPVFCDIDPVTLCIDVDKAEELVSERTKAVIGMDYDCILCDHDRLNAFAARHGIRVIHDAAHSIGSRYKGQMVGSFSDICMFSFDPVKTITCIDGGALIVKTEEEQKILQEMRLIGMGQAPKVMYQNKRAWTYDVTRLGFRYHLANLHAALGVTQLGQMDAISASRRATCLAYNAELGKLPEVSVPQTDFEDITPFLYYIRVPADRRQALRDFLLERGVDTGIHWQPGHWFTLLADCRRGDLSVTEQVGTEILSLPLHSMMSTADQERVIAGVSAFFKH
jgi:dTDP-4-amino-4,6-dideoxygalactose transaminase